jgi:hypothetical protein
VKSRAFVGNVEVARERIFVQPQQKQTIASHLARRLSDWLYSTRSRSAEPLEWHHRWERPAYVFVGRRLLRTGVDPTNVLGVFRYEALAAQARED